jgi:hypothetical protein
MAVIFTECTDACSFYICPLVVDPRKRQFLPQPIPLSLVARGIDALREQKSFVQPVQLLLNRLDPWKLNRATAVNSWAA